MMMLFICFLNLYFIGLYNSAKLNGNILIIAMFFGFSEIIGIFIGEYLVVFNPIYGINVCVAVILLMSSVIKMV